MLTNARVFALAVAMSTGFAGCGGGGGGQQGSGGRAVSGGGGAIGGHIGQSGTGGSGHAGGTGAAGTDGGAAGDGGGMNGGGGGPVMRVGGASGTAGMAGAAGATGGAAGGPGTNVMWHWNGTDWMAGGAPPACPSPLLFAPPVDFSAVTAVLYPGQTRGGNYKAHGGFLFTPGTNASVTVRAPMDGYVYRGARYVEADEVQYLFDIINPCGIMYRFDHLLTLSARFQAIAETFPPAGASSATTVVAPGEQVMTGDIIATAVGFAVTGNTSVDWGVYDLRQRNAVSNDDAWLASHPGEQAAYAVCWLDAFTASTSAQLRALPGGDGVAGTMSDYCR